MDVRWTVGRVGGSTTTHIEKIPYVAKQRVKDDMTEAQKNGVIQWNLMVSKLQEAGLM